MHKYLPPSDSVLAEAVSVLESVMFLHTVWVVPDSFRQICSRMVGFVQFSNSATDSKRDSELDFNLDTAEHSPIYCNLHCAGDHCPPKS